MGRRIPTISGDEQDVLHAPHRRSWRRLVCRYGRAGVTAWIKRNYRRRERRVGKREVRL